MTLIPIAFIYIIITIVSTYFICADKFYILDQLEHHVPRLWVKRFGNHLKEIITVLGNYLKAEAILILFSFKANANSVSTTSVDLVYECRRYLQLFTKAIDIESITIYILPNKEKSSNNLPLILLFSF